MHIRWALHSSKVLPFPFFQLWIYWFLMSFMSITYANDVLDEFNAKMTVSKFGTTCKILQYLAEPSKVLQKYCSSLRFLWNWDIMSIYAQPWRLKVFSVLFFTRFRATTCPFGLKWHLTLFQGRSGMTLSGGTGSIWPANFLGYIGTQNNLKVIMTCFQLYILTFVLPLK